MDRGSDPNSSTKTKHTTFTYIVFFLILLLIVLAIIGGRHIFKPHSGWGSWGSGVTGPCLPTIPGDCNSPGTQTTVQLCIPDPTTNRGCIGDDGMQTFAPKMSTQNCKVRCAVAAWSISKSDCVQTDPCPNPRTAGLRTMTYTCKNNSRITRGNGVNQCTLLESVDESDGSAHIVKRYNPGDVVVRTELCYDYPRLDTCGTWAVKLPNNDRFVENIGGITGLEGPYILSPDCQTGDDPAYSVLEEGILTVPLVCVNGDGDAQDSSSCPNLSQDAHDGQWCDTRMITPSDVRTGSVPEDLHAVACSGTYQSDAVVVFPCRYKPLSQYDYGRGDDLNLVISSVLLIFSGSDVICPLYGPGGSLPLRDPGIGEIVTTDLPDVPLVTLNPNSQVTPACTSQMVAFNTGVLLVLGVRSLYGGGLGCLADVGCIISLRYRGWLGMSSNGSAVWQQASVGYGDPGLTTMGAAELIVELLGPVIKGAPVGYPVTCIGTVNLSIKTANGGSIHIPNISGNASQSTTMDNITAQLYNNQTDMCTREIQGYQSCNVLNRRSTLQGPMSCHPQTVTE